MSSQRRAVLDATGLPADNLLTQSRSLPEPLQLLHRRTLLTLGQSGKPPTRDQLRAWATEHEIGLDAALRHLAEAELVFLGTAHRDVRSGDQLLSAGLGRAPQRTEMSVMTQTSHTDRQHPTPYPLDDTGTPRDQEARRGPSGYWIGLLALLPIACCGLPLLLAVGVTAGSGAVLGGVAGTVLMLVCAAILGVWGMRRRARSTRTADTFVAATGTRPMLLMPPRRRASTSLGLPQHPRRAGDPRTRPHSTSTQEQQP